MTKKPERYLLLVDDSDDEREAMQRLLEIEGYSVIPVPGGQEALNHLRATEPPFLIILDVMMPGKDGWQFRAEQLQDARLAQIPVLVLSGDGRVSEQALSLGIREFLPKPPDFESLLAMVARHCH
jgi:CheY-like chemotaxis protein